MSRKSREEYKSGSIRIALVGNPNSGKTAIFNLLTLLNHKVSNYPGITIERKTGIFKLSDGKKAIIADLPGTYSITPESLDEKIVAEEVMGWVHGKEKPDIIISVVDASNLSRNLYLTTQLLDLNIPVIVALNMMDRVKSEGKEINSDKLRDIMGVAAVVPMSAKEKWGVSLLRQSIEKVANSANISEKKQTILSLKPETGVRVSLAPVVSFLKSEFGYSDRLAMAQALRIITRKSAINLYESVLKDTGDCDRIMEELTRLREKAIGDLKNHNIPHRILEATLRFKMVDSAMDALELDSKTDVWKVSRSEKADKILTHKWFGPLIFVAILYFIFNSVFTWSVYPMDWISNGVSWISNQVLQWMAPGIFRDLLVNGVIAGVGAVLVFLPQILVIVFFLTLLEDSGYMARVAFMLDRVMTWSGLHGRSVLPLMSGYACAIPGVMATRTIDSWKERLITILILPLISCSARLPVYTLLIGSFIPREYLFGMISVQGLVLVFMYFLGTATAFVMALLFSKFIPVKGKSTFVMELPPYRIPMMTSVANEVYLRGKQFIRNAGQIILAISIILWGLATFPLDQNDSAGGNTGAGIDNSYAGRIGKVIEPVIEPLGFDWKIGIGLVTSFAAREVMVSTLATLYNVENTDGGVIRLSESLRNDTDPATGKKRYGILFALSLMVYYVYAAQCMATFAIVRTETNSWKWPFLMIGYMTALAYLMSLAVYQGGLLLGFGG